MAFMKLLILTAVLAVSAHANFAWQEDDNWPKFQPIRMPVPPTPPFRPFAPFPPFRPGFGQFQNFPNFPQIPLPVVPTPGQIRNVEPGPGQVFNGAAVQSSSHSYRDKDGKLVRTGGSSVLVNDNGKVQEFKHGNAPPDIDVPIRVPTKLKLDFPKLHFPEMKPLELHFPEMKPLEFPEFKMPVFKPIEQIDPEKMKNYVPKEGETFVGVAKETSSSSRTVNGKTVSDGASSIIVNDNGQADEEHVAFHKGDKDFVEN